MLKSEKLALGPAMSFSGAYNRLFSTGKPAWFKWLAAPWLLMFWWIGVACFYTCGGFIFFITRRRRKKLVEYNRHREMVEAIKTNSTH